MYTLIGRRFTLDGRRAPRLAMETLVISGTFVATSMLIAKPQEGLAGCISPTPSPEQMAQGAAYHGVSEQDPEVLSCVDSTAWIVQNRLLATCGKYLSNEKQ